MSARTGRRILVLLLLSALLKLTFLAAPRSDLLGEREKDGGVFHHHGEEFSRASIAIALREGPLMPVGDYQWTHFFGGSLVVGIAAIPYFELFGENLFVLKLVPLTFELLTVLFGFLLLDRLFGARAAWIGGLMLAVSSPGQAVLSTIAWGTHSSMNAFVTLGLLCYVSSLPRDDGAGGSQTRPEWRFAFGLVSGFAIWFGYSYFLVLLAVGAFELTRGRAAFAARPLGAFVLGLLIGLSPWLRYNFAHDFAGLAIYGRSMGEHFAPLSLLGRLPGRALELALELLPGSLGHRDIGFVLGHWLALPAAAAILVLSACGLVRLARTIGPALRARRNGPALAVDPGWLLTLHVGAVAFALMLGGFWPDENLETIPGHRYLSPLFPGTIGLAAAGADRMLERGAKSGFAAVGLVGVVLATSLVGHAGLVRTDQWGVLWRIDADRRPGHGRWIAARWGDDPQRMSAISAAALERRGPREREELLRGMAEGLDIVIRAERTRALGVYDLERLLVSRDRLIAELPEPYRAYFRGD